MSASMGSEWASECERTSEVKLVSVSVPMYVLKYGREYAGACVYRVTVDWVYAGA